jgi:microcystin-dependent protein
VPITVLLYAQDANPAQVLAPATVGTTGGLPHTNLMPYNTLNFCIALSGIFPSRN